MTKDEYLNQEERTKKYKTLDQDHSHLVDALDMANRAGDGTFHITHTKMSRLDIGMSSLEVKEYLEKRIETIEKEREEL